MDRKDENKQARERTDEVKDLPQKETTREQAEKVKGGTGGDDRGAFLEDQS